MVGADLGNVVLELGEDLDLEGARVWGNSGLRRTAMSHSPLNSGPRVSSHVSVLEEVGSWL